MAKTPTTIEVTCPECLHKQEKPMKEWMESTRETKIWDGRRKEYRTTGGPESTLLCVHCNASTPAKQWHRQAEREYFKAQGWTTENMEKLGW